MRFKGVRLDVVYEARFFPASLSVAMDPRHVTRALFSSITARFPIATQDVTLASGNRASDVRVRLTLFGGRAIIELDADKFGAHFENATADDVGTIKECLELALKGVALALPKDRLAEHTIRAMMWLQLLDEPKTAREFLSSLKVKPIDGLLARIPNSDGIAITPGLRFELAHEEHRWLYNFELTRAYRNPAEIFQTATLGCLDGSPVATMDDRIALLEKLVGATWEQLGIEGAKSSAA